jgi:hypothetical protein
MEAQERYEKITEARYQEFLAEEDARQDLVDEILLNEELFTRMAWSFANHHLETIPNMSFLTYATNLLRRERDPEYKSGWQEDV